MKTPEKMTNKELAKYCEENGIDIDSKNVSKPTKTEYIASIKRAEASNEPSPEIDPVENLDDDVDDFLDISESGEKDGMQEKVEKPKAKKMTRAQKRKQQYNELMALKRVMITKNDNNQTTVKNQVEFCTWGNRLLGHHTDRFITGREWHVREGALRNLQDMKISRPIQDDEGNTIRFETVQAYIIQRLDPLTKQEIEVIAKRQTIRDSSIESLI